MRPQSVAKSCIYGAENSQNRVIYKVVIIFVFMTEPIKASPSSIEAKMNQIRALMARLQQDEGSLDDSLGLYNEATNLITQCQQMLDEAADRINNPSSSQP